MSSPPLLAESHRFSMIFLLSSGCYSSLRWKKGKRKTDRRKAGELESGVQGEEVAHMDGMWMTVSEVRAKLELEPNVSVDEVYETSETLRAFSGTVCGGARCESPRNR